MNISPVVDLEITSFTGATVSEREAGIFNGVVDVSQTTPNVTQRPSITIFENANSTVTDNRGRGIYYWDANTDLYFINNDTIYKNSYSTVIGAITAGTQKCKILESYDTGAGAVKLIVLDHENNKGWTVDTGGTLTDINTADADFPDDIAPGGVVLNGFLYVMTSDGDIYNSDLDLPASWTQGNNTNAEREEDKGVYLGKHHNEIVALGTRTIEFFRDNANAAGSPLIRREDISYNTGCADGNSVWEDGDRLFFVGAEPSGNLGVYTLINYRPNKVSKPGFDSLLTQALTKEGYSAIGSGLTANGHTFYILSLYTTPTDISVEHTYVFDLTTGLWGDWETTLNLMTEFPLMDWSVRTGDSPRYGEGIMQNGDLFNIQDDFVPTDTIESSIYVVSGYVEDDYVVSDAGSTTAITMKVRFGQFNGDSNKNKFPKHIRPRMGATAASQTMTVRWADNNSSSFTAGKSLDVSDQYASILNGGRFRRRNHELETSSTEQVWIEGIEMDLQEGTT